MEIYGYYTDSESLLDGVKKLREDNLKIKDVRTPYPVHHLDKALGLKRSLLPKAGMVAGIIGATGAFLFQTWVFTVDYPLNIGGKPHFAYPSFIPLTFELGVLFAALALVFGFLFRSQLGLGAKNKIYDEKNTDDRFGVILDAGQESSDDELSAMVEKFKAAGGMGVQIIDN
jgi:hypothetical protein